MVTRPRCALRATALSSGEKSGSGSGMTFGGAAMRVDRAGLSRFSKMPQRNLEVE